MRRREGLQRMESVEREVVMAKRGSEGKLRGISTIFFVGFKDGWETTCLDLSL